MAKRKRAGISKSVRFEVFKRDSFTCQYCGASAPAIVLELDHIDAHSKGGSDEVINLITACVACNSGKSDRGLSDDAVIKKQHAQLAELQERREQLEMMLKWRDANIDLDKRAEGEFIAAYAKQVPGWELNEKGWKSARDLIRRFGLVKALSSLDLAASRVVELKGGKATAESAGRVIGLAFVLAEPDDVQALYRVRARIRRRWNYVHDGICISLLKRLLKAGVSIGQVESECDRLIAESGTSFRWWQSEIEGWLSGLVSSTGPDV